MISGKQSPPRAAAGAASALTGADRRQFGRRATVRHAWIIAGAQRRIACVIRNVSEGGALLELDGIASLPARFTLDIEGTGLIVACEARHRGQTSLGVLFLEPGAGARLLALGPGVQSSALATGAPAAMVAIAPAHPAVNVIALPAR